MSLLKFLFTDKCPHCQQRIERTAKFCRHCGAGNARSWRKCNACGVSVAADSQHCWNCNANLAAQPRDHIFSDRWRRTPGIFATRVTIETPHDRLRHGIQVDDGTLGALLNNGVMKAELGPGYHPQTSFLDRLLGTGKTGGFVEAVVAVNDPVSSLVSLMDTAALFTKDRSPVEAAVLVRVRLADFATFARRLLPTGTDVVRDDDLLLPHTARVAEILRRHLSRLDVAEVARSTELRHELEAALGEELPALLKDYGLDYCGLEDVRLDSPEIARVREAEGDIAKTGRELAWAKMKRELEQSHKLAELKDEFAFKEQLDQWTHEYTLTSLDRDHIVRMRQIALGKAQELADSDRRGEVRVRDTEWQTRASQIELEQDLRELDAVRKRQFEAMEKMQALRLERQKAETDNAIRAGQGLKDVPAAIAAGALGGEQGLVVVRALEALRPLPQVTIVHAASGYAPAFVPSFMPAGTPPAPVPGVAAAASSLEVMAQRYISSVGVVVVGSPGGTLLPIGTAWVVAGRGIVATNAHVAKEIASARNEAAMSAWVIFSGAVSPLPVSGTRIHPGYEESAAKGHPVPSCDVAVLDLAGALPSPGLPLASREKAYALRELQAAAYLGFPMENLAGGGTSLERPKAIAKRGSISSLEDWHMRHSDNPALRQLIKHDLGVAGGASGSPMFDEVGEVIGIISAGNMERLYDPQTKQFRRIPSGVALNFAQRIDVLLDWLG